MNEQLYGQPGEEQSAPMPRVADKRVLARLLWVVIAIAVGSIAGQVALATSAWGQQSARVNELQKTLAQDEDGDGLTRFQELEYGTNALLADTDGDGLSDGLELQAGTDPRRPADARYDSDGDGRTNVQEVLAGTDPFTAESPVRRSR